MPKFITLAYAADNKYKRQVCKQLTNAGYFLLHEGDTIIGYVDEQCNIEIFRALRISGNRWLMRGDTRVFTMEASDNVYFK